MKGVSCALGAGVQDVGGFRNTLVESLQGLCGVFVGLWERGACSPSYQSHNRVEGLQGW